jgi:hypothetical protein
MEIGHRDIPNDGPKRSLMQLFYRTYSGGQRPRPADAEFDCHTMSHKALDPSQRQLMAEAPNIFS